MENYSLYFCNFFDIVCEHSSVFLKCILRVFFPLSFHETSARNKKFTVYLNLSEYILGYIVARKPDMLNYYGDINFYFSAS